MFPIAQLTYVPDDDFEIWLELHRADGSSCLIGDTLSLGNGIGNDDYVITAKINTLTYLNIINEYITDLTGIQDFAALTHLYCQDNQLTILDLSNNTNLIELDCNHNQLTSLDLSNNSALTFLECNNNDLNCLNIQNGNNTNLQFWSQNNPNLTCIEADDPTWATANFTSWQSIDSSVTFSTNCNYPLGCFSTPTTITEQTNNINLYPNPTNNLITLDIEGYNGSVNVRYMIYKEGC